MNIRLNPTVITFFIIVMTCFPGCKKTTPSSSNNNPPPGGNGTPAITPVGTPAGDPVTKTIGTGGGTLASADGRIQLTIPAGALAANTDITIQPVTNYAPLGFGLAYDLLPNGTIFSKPATLTFHYTAGEINGSHPYFLYIAYQDSSNAWRTNLKQQHLDTIAKTVSLDISHFTEYVEGVNLVTHGTGHLTDRLRANETIQISAEETTVISDDGRLSAPVPLADNLIGQWQVFGEPGGSADNGTIVGTGANVVYHAPAHIDRSRTVQVVAVLHASLYLESHGEILHVPETVSTDINLVADSAFNYSVFIAYIDSLVLGIPGAIYYDQVKFDLSIDYTIDNIYSIRIRGAISNIQNSTPTVTPPSLELVLGGFHTGELYSWTPDAHGVIDIKDTVPRVFPDALEDSTVGVQIFHSDATHPGFIETFIPPLPPNPPIPVNPMAFEYNQGIPVFFTVDLRKKDPYFDHTNDFEFNGNGKSLIVAIVRN